MDLCRIIRIWRIIVLGTWICAVVAEQEYNPAISCPHGWSPRATLNGHCYSHAHKKERVDYAGAEHACRELNPEAHVASKGEESWEKFLKRFIFHHWPTVSVAPLKFWLQKKDSGGCQSATIDSRSSDLHYNHHENCSEHLHYICEAKQTLLHGLAEQNQNALPHVYKRHKYGRKGAPEMELSNLQLGPQKRSHDEGEKVSHYQEEKSHSQEEKSHGQEEKSHDQEEKSHDEEEKSHDEDSSAHAREKRALGSSNNGNDGQVLVGDALSFYNLVKAFLDGMNSHSNETTVYRDEYVTTNLATAEGLYERLRNSNLTTLRERGDVMIQINDAVIVLGSIGLRTKALGDSVKKYRGPQGLTLWVNRATVNTHRQLTLRDGTTELVIPQDISVTDGSVMYGIVAVMTPDASYSALPGGNDTSSMAARMVFAQVVSENNTYLTTGGTIVIKFGHQRATKSDEIAVCANVYTAGGSFVHWSLQQCEEAKYQFSASGTECNCYRMGTFSNYQVFNPLAAGLKLLSLLGCAVTLASCLITALVVIGYQLMKTTISFVRMMFLVSLGAAEAVFVTGTAYADVKGVCGMVALWLHFSTLASFCWLLSYTLLLGNEMRQEKNHHLDLKLYNLIGWMVPACIVTITAIWRYRDYRDPILCWVSSDGYVYLSFVIPSAIIIGIILLFMLYDLKLLIVKREDMKKVLGRPVAWSGIRSVFFLLPLLGCTWMFAEYSVITRNLLTQLLFAIFNTLLGVCIFVFMCHFNAEIRIAKRLKKIVPHTNYAITQYAVPPVDPSYEPTEKYPYPVLTTRRVEEPKKQRLDSLLPGAVNDEWLGVTSEALCKSRMDVTREQEGEGSRPGSSGNETSSTLLPETPNPPPGGASSPQTGGSTGSAASRKRIGSGNKVGPSDRPLQKSDSMRELLVENAGPPHGSENESSL